MKYYYPELCKKINLVFIDLNNTDIHQPWKNLEFFYLKNGWNDYLHIPSNTQLSEFLNKFNESHIIPKLGEIKFNEIIKNNLKISFIQEMTSDFGWDWMNWISEKGKMVLSQLDKINSNEITNISQISRDSLKILGKIKLKESIDYGKETENYIDTFLENGENEDVWEVKEFIRHLEENDFVVISFGQKILHKEGIFTGEIDFVLMHKKTKNIHICDLKTSSTADTIDYWRQVLLYKKILQSNNAKIKDKISNDLVIIHINKKKNISQIFIKNFKHKNLEKIVNDAIKLKREYIKEIKK